MVAKQKKNGAWRSVFFLPVLGIVEVEKIRQECGVR